MAKRTRTYEWDDVRPIATELTARSGLEFYRHALEQGWQSPIGYTLDIRVVDIQLGRAVVRCSPAEYHCNPAGFVHGGVIAAILDTAMGAAAHSTLEAGDAYSTMDLTVHYTRPVPLGSGELSCEARVVNSGRRIVLTDAELHDSDGRLCSHAVSTLMVMRSDG